MKIDRELLEEFVKKFHLNGDTDSATLVVENKKLRTQFMTENKNVFGSIQKLNDVELPDGNFCIKNASQLLGLLKILEKGTITIQVHSHNDKNVGLTLEGTSTSVYFVLADPSMMPKIPSVKTDTFKNVLAYVTLAPEQLDACLRAKGSLPLAKTFELRTNGKTGKVVIGAEGEQNTSKITIVPQLWNFEEGKEKSFTVKKYPLQEISNIFSVVRDTSVDLIIYEEGLVKVVSHTPEILSTFYVMEFAK